MRGRGQYVGDIRLPGMLEVAFLRSPVAHARIRAIRKPAGREHAVFIADDLAGVRPIRADTSLPGFKSSPQPVLATGKVRHVGELVAMCVAPTRAEAEDLAARSSSTSRSCPPSPTCWRRASRARRSCTSTGATTSSSRPASTTTSRPSRRKAADHGDARAAHRAAVHVRRSRAAAWSPTGDRRLEPARGLHLDADAAHRALRPRRVPRPRRGRRSASSRPMSAAASATRASCCPRRSALALARAQARRAAALDRGPARAPDRQRQLPRAPLRPHRLRRRRRPAARRSTARRPSIPAPTRPIRSRPAWRRRRSARSCRASTTSRTIAAAPTRSPPTSRRSCPTAASRAPACASRWR